MKIMADEVDVNSKSDVLNEEKKFMAKYPGSTIKASDVLQKRLQKGMNKYFDSGDYMMNINHIHGAEGAKVTLKSQQLQQRTTGAAAPGATKTSGTVSEIEQNICISGGKENLGSLTLAEEESEECHDDIIETRELGTEVPRRTSGGRYSLAVTSGDVLIEGRTHRMNSVSEAPFHGLDKAEMEKLKEVTGDTIATPETVQAVRKKSLLVGSTCGGGAASLSGCAGSNLFLPPTAPGISTTSASMYEISDNNKKAASGAEKIHP